VRGARVHNLRDLDVSVPLGRIVAVAGVSGSGKTTLVLEALVPALASLAGGGPLPALATSLATDATRRVVVVDASPIGANVRSTVATYSGVMDGLRRVYAALPAARQAGLTRGWRGAGPRPTRQNLRLTHLAHPPREPPSSAFLPALPPSATTLSAPLTPSPSRPGAPLRGRPRPRMGAARTPRPASVSARRRMTSIWALTERSSSAAHLATAAWTAGSSLSRTCLRSLPATGPSQA